MASRKKRDLLVPLGAMTLTNRPFFLPTNFKCSIGLEAVCLQCCDCDCDYFQRNTKGNAKEIVLNFVQASLCVRVSPSVRRLISALFLKAKKEGTVVFFIAFTKNFNDM